MKKLSLIIAMLMSAGILFNVYADDLGELDSLLNQENTTSGNTTTGDQVTSNSATTGDQVTSNSATTGDQATINDTSNSDLDTLDNLSTGEDTKIVLSTTGETTVSSVSLTFKKLDAYANYKIYYSKNSEDNLLEKQVSAENSQENITVTINGLESDTDYQFIAKAFDNNGDPVATTESDPLDITTEQVHNAPSDNIIHNPVVKVDGSKITISYEPGVDVAKVQISLSEDGQTFKPLTTIDASQTSYTFTAKSIGKKYIKVVPIATDGTIGVCKVGKTNVDNNTFTATVKPKNTQKKIGEPKTGPEMYLLIILAIFAYIVYALRKRA